MEDTEIRVRCSAHHEASHVVIAAIQGLKLRSQGLMVDQIGEGLAFYFKEPDDTDASRERVILATLAGFKAENRYRAENSLPLREYFELIWSPDWREARVILSQFSTGYLAGDNCDTVLARLEAKTEILIEQNWPVIKTLAAKLLSKQPEPFKSLKSGAQWSQCNSGLCVAGEEAVRILQAFQITALCD